MCRGTLILHEQKCFQRLLKSFVSTAWISELQSEFQMVGPATENAPMANHSLLFS